MTSVTIPEHSKNIFKIFDFHFFSTIFFHFFSSKKSKKSKTKYLSDYRLNSIKTLWGCLDIISNHYEAFVTDFRKNIFCQIHNIRGLTSFKLTFGTLKMILVILNIEITVTGITLRVRKVDLMGRVPPPSIASK